MACFCGECGSKLIEKELEMEGMVPFCPTCESFRFPMYNVAVSMIVINKENNKYLLIQQYGRKKNILVAGYVNKTENLEEAVVREVKEETGMTVTGLSFNTSSYFEPSNTLMCNFTVYVEHDRELNPNAEIDSYSWFTEEEARANIFPGSLAERFLLAYLNK